ncbi:Short-chain dehydrogenase/reductase SDR [Lasiodiplodia theobromae]|uniref:Putative oxidoreductase n=1 Tax=Lasiodiplodia theobromae TaxID=45133 RepID=A0A5N5D6S5_9PEZI|nr:Short-chain dehydrogenase/reductase SDR [Lasiodiplodia theobromae]KAB2573275.1 putative oxidoreductase [Lasiodiplodia theobromae]KAF4543305.1 Short-chain dehydrogenase/reductase SDR [Lasiodiplodia theobromae]
MARVWLITGCSSGFGRAIALAAAAHGDKVVATARDVSKLADLRQRGIVTKTLDVLSPDAEIQAVVDDVRSTVGDIDVLVNNAGYILVGAIEECSAQEIERQFATNVFGQLAVLRAVVPSMRSRRTGTIANLGSIGGWQGSPAAGIYCATKAAIAIYTESLRAELAPFGVRVTCIEPGYFRTNFLDEGSGRKTVAKKTVAELDTVEGSAVAATRSALAAYNKKQPGDPDKGARVIVQALTGSGPCQGKDLPPRLALGNDAVGFIGQALERNRRDLDAWKDIVSKTDCDE